MKAEYFANSDYQVLTEALQAFSESSEVQSLLLLACDENAWQASALQPILSNVKLPLIGGVFPQIIFNQQAFSQGFVLVGMEFVIEPVVIHGLSDNSVDFESQLDALIAEEVDFSSMLVLVDGLSSRVAEFVESLFVTFGSEVSYIGGGAGSLSFESKACVLSNQGMFVDAAVLGLMQAVKSIQVGHGWQAVHKGHIVTQVEKNRVLEIDYRNAFEVYKSVVEPNLDAQITQENFFDMAQSFPLGIKRALGDYIVRDPIAVDDQGALVCVGELSLGDHIDILSAQPKDLIDSMSQIAQKSKKEKDAVTEGILLIDCISRALFLKEAFPQELNAVRDVYAPSVPLFGALVLGEIANSGAGYLEFYNKTSVIARF